MATITLHGNAINTVGQLPTNGQNAPDFELAAKDLSAKKLGDYSGKKVILNIFPSVDTDVCAASVRKFNEEANKIEDTKILCISKDLPFAQNRFCGAEGLDNVEMLSDFRGNFSTDYGVGIADGPLAGLHSRAIIVLDGHGKIVHQEQVPEIAQEPNYQNAINAVKAI